MEIILSKDDSKTRGSLFILFFAVFLVSKTGFDFFNPAICGNLADTAVI